MNSPSSDPFSRPSSCCLVPFLTTTNLKPPNPGQVELIRSRMTNKVYKRKKKVVSLASIPAQSLPMKKKPAADSGNQSVSGRPQRDLRLPSYLKTHQLISLKKTTRAKRLTTRAMRLAKRKATKTNVPKPAGAGNGTTENVAKDGIYMLALPALPAAALSLYVGRVKEMPVTQSENEDGSNDPPVANSNQPSTLDSSNDGEAKTFLQPAMDCDKMIPTNSPKLSIERENCLLMGAQVADNPTFRSSLLNFSCIYKQKLDEMFPIVPPPELDKAQQPESDKVQQPESDNNLERIPDENIIANGPEKSDAGASRQDKADGSSLTTIAGCDEEEEFAHAAENIVLKHGDILANSFFEGTLRSHLLRSACAIYKKLERLNFTVLTLDEVESLRRDVQDLEKAQVEVGWLADRLDDLHAAKQLEQRNPLLDLELQLKHNQKIIKGLAKRLMLQEKKYLDIKAQLEAAQEETAVIHRNILETKAKVTSFVGKSLVDGI